MTRSAQGKRVAVIGSGLAGLTTAYLLRQRGITVYLIEKVSNKWIMSAGKWGLIR